jgi:hypothetical protein
VSSPDLLTEATRLRGEAHLARVPLRVLGGVAVRLHAPPTVPDAFIRIYNDLDLMTVGPGRTSVLGFMESMGYAGDRHFNTLNGYRRLVFYDSTQSRRVDIFVESFEMCHRIPIQQRFDKDLMSIPLAELLLTKLQVVQLNEKDIRDVLLLVRYHEVGAHDLDVINLEVVARLMAADWGFGERPPGILIEFAAAFHPMGWGLQMSH